MPSFGEPSPRYNYQLAAQKDDLDDWFTHRQVPKAEPGKLLLASWNIANLGEQKRRDKDLKLIAHLMSRFELIAVQEVKNKLDHFEKVLEFMGDDYDWIINDTAGNTERLAYIYRKGKIKRGKMFGEVAYAKKDFPRRTVVVKYKRRSEQRVEVYHDLEFILFDRNPFLGTFEVGNLDFTIANVHLYFGAFKNASTIAERAKYARRVMEIFALSKWAKKRRDNDGTYDKDIILLGDMNVPMMDPDDAAYAALKASGLQLTDYTSKTGGSNLGGTKTYDQLAITPGDIADRVLDSGVFDFDNGIFRTKWDQAQALHPGDTKRAQNKRASYFNSYMKFHVSDHRPLWMQLDIS